MNQQLWSGLTAAALILTSFSTASASRADQPLASDDESRVNVSLEESLPEPIAASPSASTSEVSAEDAVKVGEYQSQDEPEEAEETIALIQPHEMGGRQAATLFVRDIPVLTFLGAPSASTEQNSPAASDSAAADPDVKVATTDETTVEATQSSAEVAAEPTEDYANDPTWRATSIAAQLNQLYRDNLDANAISVSWDAERESYVIEVNDEELVEINSDTILPDTTSDPAEDALQVTNRLRRQMGNAPPLREIAGRPEPEPQEISLGSIQFTIQGLASWYGPGFNGNRSASGEIFNQNALTAAHRSLPFGTQVRVTNLRNGQSVVVRINDRGPYHGRRVIDLSAAAARAVGMLQTGTAPVSIDVLGAAGNLANGAGN